MDRVSHKRDFGMTARYRVRQLGQEFKKYVLETYKVAWHELPTQTLWEAIEDYENLFLRR